LEQPRPLDLNNHFCNKCGKVATYFYEGKYLCTVDTQITITQARLKAEEEVKHAKSVAAAEQVKPVEAKAPVKPVTPVIPIPNTKETKNASQPTATKAAVAGTTKTT
jgi:hypothetical protein